MSNLREVEAIQLHNLKKLSDLRGLARLEKVGSDLELLKLGITSLQGLKVGLIVLGSLTIAENHNITNLVGLNAIPEVGSHLIIGPNDQLENLSGIEEMKVVGNFLVGYEFIFIKEDPVPLLNLQDISSIQQVKSIGGYLRVGMEGCVDEKFLISLRDKASGIDSQLSEFEISKTDKIRILQGIACSNI